MDEYESELINIFNIIWKRKWLIIILTFFCVIIAGVISFLLPPKWEVDAIINPSKFVYRTEEGLFRDNLFVEPKSITSLINQGAYNNPIATELSIDQKDFPKLRAENIEDTYQVRVFIKENDAEKAKLVLHSLLNRLKKWLDYYTDNEIKIFDSQIKSKETEKLILARKIEAYNNKISIIKQRKQEIEKEMINIRKKIEDLEKERDLILKKKNRSESESIALLLFSNEILQNSMNRNMLNESLGSKKIEEEIIDLEIENKERLMDQINNEITELTARKGRIYYAQIIKEPTSSISPVSPKRKFNVVIAGMLGLIISSLLAFTLEHLKKYKPKAKIK